MNEERCKRLEERQAALEQRVWAAIDVAIATLRDEIGVEDALDRLAALRSPEVVIPSEPVDVAEMQAQIHEADMDRIAASERLNAANAALATARRERDEAVGVVRDWLGWRAGSKGPGVGGVLSRARALVAGQATPDARDAEIAGWCEASKAMTGEIATLRAQLDTALARVAELEARDREGRWLVERSNHRQVGKVASDKQRAEMDDYSRRADTYLSGTPPADPARGLIERAVAWFTAVRNFRPVPETAKALLAYLRAYLGGE